MCIAKKKKKKRFTEIVCYKEYDSILSIHTSILTYDLDIEYISPFIRNKHVTIKSKFYRNYIFLLHTN